MLLADSSTTVASWAWIAVGGAVAVVLLCIVADIREQAQGGESED